MQPQEDFHSVPSSSDEDDSSSSSSSVCSAVDEAEGQAEDDIYTQMAKPWQSFTFRPAASAASSADEEQLCTLEMLQSIQQVPGTGGAVWPAAWMIAKWISTQEQEARKTSFSSTSSTPLNILELGCGVGFVGLVAAVALENSRVLLTDYDDDALSLVRRNIQRNSKFVQADRVGTSVLKWGGDEADLESILAKPPLNGATPDLVICSDLFYEPENAPLLAKTLHLLRTRDQRRKSGEKVPRILLSFLERVAEREKAFFDSFAAVGLPPFDELERQVFVTPSKKNKVPRNILLLEWKGEGVVR